MSANPLENLTPEQTAILSAFGEQPDVIMQLSIAVLQGDVETFSYTLAGMEKGKTEAILFFRKYREFLMLPEIEKIIK